MLPGKITSNAFAQMLVAALALVAAYPTRFPGGPALHRRLFLRSGAPRTRLSIPARMRAAVLDVATLERLDAGQRIDADREFLERVWEKSIGGGGGGRSGGGGGGGGGSGGGDNSGGWSDSSGLPVSRFVAIEPLQFRQWLRTYHEWTTEAAYWMQENLNEGWSAEMKALLQRNRGAESVETLREKLFSLLRSMLLYQSELANSMRTTGSKLEQELSIVKELDLARPLLVAAYAGEEGTPRFVAVLDQVPMAGNAMLGQHRSCRESPCRTHEASSDQPDLNVCSLEALVWEPDISRSRQARTTDVEHLEAWLHHTFGYIMHTKEFREVRVFSLTDSES